MSNLRKKRKERKMTQEELGKALGVARTTVTLWELGINKPRTDMLIKLSRVLNCSIEELLCSET